MSVESVPPPPEDWRGEFKATLQLATPLAIAQAGMLLMSLVDTAMVGWYSASELGAVALGGAIVWLVMTLGMGVALALEPLLSQALGAGDREEAWEWMVHGTKLTFWASVPLNGAVIGFAALMPEFGVDADLAGRTVDYLLWRAPAFTVFLLMLCARSGLQAVGRTRPLLVGAALANIANFLANGLAVFGDEGLAYLGLPGVGLPALGASGAGIATSVSSTVLLLAIAPAARDLKPVARKALTVLRPKWTLVKLSTPLALQTFAEASAFSVVGILAAGISEEVVAAHQVALQLAAMTFMFALGVSSATSVRVGYAVGRGSSIVRPTVTGLVVALAVMAVAAVVFALFNEPLAAAFLPNDPEARTLAASLIAVAALFQFFDGVQVVMAGALRGAGDVHVPFVANVVAHWGIGVPSAAIFAFTLGLGAVGLWYGLAVSLLAVSTLMSARFFLQVARRRIERITNEPSVSTPG